MRNSILLFFIFFVAGAIILIKLNKKTTLNPSIGIDIE